MDAITFHHFISLMVITAYLYVVLDTDIYMKVPKGLKLPETTNKP